MQIFELHFGKKNKNEVIFDAFCYVPEHFHEKRLGSLFVVSELKNPLPQTSKLTDRIFQAIKTRFYTLSVNSSSSALAEGLKKANEYLTEEVRKENVAWLGNLSLAVVSINNFEINFTKFGALKIILARDGQVTEISQSLELEEFDPYPLKVFGKTLNGRLNPEDKIIIFNHEVFDFFSAQGLLKEISDHADFSEKALKEILQSHSQELALISGICLLISLSKLNKAKENIL